MHGFPVINSPFAPEFGALFIPLILAAILWSAVLKGFALWFAARGGQKAWFIAVLVVNTFGILEIIYLIWFRPKKPVAGESAPIIASSAQ
jgi:uncharacterized membrane protein